MEDPKRLLKATPEEKTAFDEFKKYCIEFRNAQLSDKPKDRTIIKKIGDTGLTVEIDPRSVIKAGLYERCGNSSYYVHEYSNIRIRNKAGKIVGVFNEMREVIEAELSQVFLTLGIGMLITQKIKTRTITTKHGKGTKTMPDTEAGKGTKVEAPPGTKTEVKGSYTPT